MPKLIAAGALRRVLHFDELSGSPIVEYRGGGFGWEAVFVNGEQVAVSTGHSGLVPLHEFPLGEATAAIEVAPWPWFRLRVFRVWLDSDIVYEERNSLRPPQVQRVGIIPPEPNLEGLTAKALKPIGTAIIGAFLGLLAIHLIRVLIS